MFVTVSFFLGFVGCPCSNSKNILNANAVQAACLTAATRAVRADQALLTKRDAGLVVLNGNYCSAVNCGSHLERIGRTCKFRNFTQKTFVAVVMLNSIRTWRCIQGYCPHYSCKTFPMKFFGSIPFKFSFPISIDGNINPTHSITAQHLHG